MIMKNALCFSGVIFLWISTLNYDVSTFYKFGGDESNAKNFSASIFSTSRENLKYVVFKNGGSVGIFHTGCF
jgi:hypothetical protein